MITYPEAEAYIRQEGGIVFAVERLKLLEAYLVEVADMERDGEPLAYLHIRHRAKDLARK